VAADVLGGTPERAQPRVVLFEKADFERGYNEADKELDNRLRSLVQQGDIGVVVTDALAALPGALRLNRDLELRLPDIAGPVRAAVLTALFGTEAHSGPADDSWSRYASALDFEKIAFAGLKGQAAVRDLADRVKSRLQRMGATKGMRLADIHGLGEAKTQAEIFIADIESYLKGTIPWSEVDRGMLLVGPPGTGKTMLAKAISKETGVRFIHASASEWQASSHLGEHIQSIRNSFSMARRFAPSILFIDEFDSIGRRGHGGQNEFYHTAVVNCVLEELQGFEDREGVVVVAATNRAEGVDPALKRAGRLDRLVEVHYPTIDALEKIYAYYIAEQKKIDLEHGALNLRELARLTFGQTGADVELYVRGAARRARMRASQGGSAKITQDDVVAEIMKSPTGESGAVRLSPEEMRRVAIHEAGHALIRLTGPDKGELMSFLSITPRSDGTLGFVFNAPDERHTRTRAELNEMVRVLFGGRAAESVVFGEGAISSGSGGPSPSADLAQATRLVTAMAAQYGFSQKGGLFWRDKALPAKVEAEVRRELDKLYKETRARIQQNRRLLDKIVKILLEKQEITGPELRAMLGR
jgi:ATP-dependent Zn protease